MAITRSKSKAKATGDGTTVTGNDATNVTAEIAAQFAAEIAAATASAPFRFLDLPPELRNRIYHFAEIDEGDVDVTNSGYLRPPLLQSCRQVRAETLKMYYTGRRFYVSIRGYNSDQLCKLKATLPTLAGGHPVQTTRRSLKWGERGDPNWANLLVWLQRFHASTVTGLSRPNLLLAKYALSTTEELMISGLFDMVHELRDKSWRRLRRVLDSQRVILTSLDSRWGVDSVSVPSL